VAAGLRRRGILVRHFPHSVFRDALRISIGTSAEMEELFKTLQPLAKQIAAGTGNTATKNKEPQLAPRRKPAITAEP
jgi:hypothetical protein